MFNNTRQGYVLRNNLKLAGFFLEKYKWGRDLRYEKASLSFEDQLDKLIDRGLVVNNRSLALHYLAHLNYYRLGAYWLPFEESRSPHKFANGTTFEIVLNHYIFDREFRLHLLDGIERIEVSFRTQWAYHISQKYGPHGYIVENSSLVYKNGRHRQSLEELKEAVKRSDDLFIAHHRNTYNEEFPPAWVACEIMSLGLLSRFYSNLRAYQVRRNISATYDFDESFFEGFLEHITYVRNVCAHHSRLWNRHLSKKMPLPRNKPQGLRENIYDDPSIQTEHKIYNTLVLIAYLIELVSPNSNWSGKLIKLLERYNIDVASMGFPSDWQEKPIWCQIISES